MISLRRRQWRTTILFLLCLALMGAAGATILRRESDAAAREAQQLRLLAQDEREALALLAESPDALAARYVPASGERSPRAEMIFAGLADERTTAETVSALQATGVQAQFFVSAAQARLYPASLRYIRQAGGLVGLYLPAPILEDAEGLVSQLCAAMAQLSESGGGTPTRLLCDEAPGEALLRAAMACGLELVVYAPAAALPSFSSPEEARAYLESLPRGSLLRLTLSAGSAAPAALLSAAISGSDLTTRAETLCRENAGQLREIALRVYTVERSAAITFQGLGNDAELDAILSALDAASGKALFFVTAEDLDSHGEAVAQVLARGHDLGLVVPAFAGKAEALLTDLLVLRERLRQDYDYDAFVVRQSTGTPTAALQEAAAAGGLTLAGAMTNLTQETLLGASTPESVFDALFPDGSPLLQRGQILFARMNVYRDSAMLGALVSLIQERQSLYGLNSLAAMLQNDAMTYTWPVKAEDVLPGLAEAIAPGQLHGSALTAIQDRYLGSDWITSESTLPGFTGEEIRTLNRTGKVPNTDRAVFLTFDDWGTDASITPLLDVLAAHGVKATFFVRTQNVHYNPNLLRAIAVQGHEIACHTHTHLPLARDKTGTGRSFASLTAQEAAALQEDVVTSFQTLVDVVGDVALDGVPALGLLFRPPTLAVSREGLTAVLDCGFTWVVSGSYSSQDYQARSAAALAQKLLENTAPGAVLVMHMSDNSIYTAQALDRYLTQKELSTGSSRVTFARLSDYLPGAR